MPVSETSKTWRAPCEAMRKTTWPRSVNFTAFDSRFTSTCWMRWPSPSKRARDAGVHSTRNEIPWATAWGSSNCTACATVAARSKGWLSTVLLPASMRE